MERTIEAPIGALVDNTSGSYEDSTSLFTPDARKLETEGNPFYYPPTTKDAIKRSAGRLKGGEKERCKWLSGYQQNRIEVIGVFRERKTVFYLSDKK